MDELPLMEYAFYLKKSFYFKAIRSYSALGLANCLMLVNWW